jgi:hypothetical protein
MSTVFVIEDEMHAEQSGEYSSYESALAELKERAELPWDQSPNQCPCTSWRSCKRNYEIVEYDVSEQLWRRIKTNSILQVSADGAVWADDT